MNKHNLFRYFVPLSILLPMFAMGDPAEFDNYPIKLFDFDSKLEIPESSSVTMDPHSEDPQHCYIKFTQTPSGQIVEWKAEMNIHYPYLRGQAFPEKIFNNFALQVDVQNGFQEFIGNNLHIRKVNLDDVQQTVLHFSKDRKVGLGLTIEIRQRTNTYFEDMPLLARFTCSGFALGV